jgi:hypothetical protein
VIAYVENDPVNAVLENIEELAMVERSPEGRRQKTIVCPTEQPSRIRTLAIIPSRPIDNQIDNRPQDAILPYKSRRL